MISKTNSILPALLFFAAPFLLAGCDDSTSDGAAGKAKAPAEAETESCRGCHRKLNPGLIADLESSPHERVPVTCEECHGDDHDVIFAVKGAVSPLVCAKCHEKEWIEFSRSRHGRHLKDGLVDPTLREHFASVGSCSVTTGCHSIQQKYPDGSVGKCGACHPTHSFSNHEARNPRVCLTCHAGADNPQYEIWLRSAHSLASPSKDGFIADCVECHDTHDVSAGLTHGLSPAVRETPPTFTPVLAVEEFAKNRELMLSRCRKCHGTRFARDALALADRWRWRGAILVEEAGDIVARLAKDGLLDPAPEDRVPNPVAGAKLRLGGAQIYDLVMSKAERIYYDMRYHLYPAMWRGAYHNDPERVVWELNDALKTSLDELRDLSNGLRRARANAEEESR